MKIQYERLTGQNVALFWDSGRDVFATGLEHTPNHSHRSFSVRGHSDMRLDSERCGPQHAQVEPNRFFLLDFGMNTYLLLQDLLAKRLGREQVDVPRIVLAQ